MKMSVVLGAAMKLLANIWESYTGSGRQKNHKSAAQSEYKQRHCESVPELLGMKDSIKPTNTKKQDEQNQHESTLGMEPPLVQPSS